jgi:hypothetical protein
MWLRRGGLQGSLCGRLFIRRQQAVNFAGRNAIATLSASNKATSELAFAKPLSNSLRVNSQLFCRLVNRDEPIGQYLFQLIRQSLRNIRLHEMELKI